MAEKTLSCVDDFEKWKRDYFGMELNCKSITDGEYIQAVIYYIAGMTDNYAIEMYNKIISF